MGLGQTERTISIWGMNREDNGRVWFPLPDRHENGHGDNAWFVPHEVSSQEIVVVAPDWIFAKAETDRMRVSVLCRMFAEVKNMAWLCPEYSNFKFEHPTEGELYDMARNLVWIDEPLNEEGDEELVFYLRRVAA